MVKWVFHITLTKTWGYYFPDVYYIVWAAIQSRNLAHCNCSICDSDYCNCRLLCRPFTVILRLRFLLLARAYKQSSQRKSKDTGFPFLQYTSFYFITKVHRFYSLWVEYLFSPFRCPVMQNTKTLHNLTDKTSFYNK